MRDLDWQVRAACRKADLEAFYAEGEDEVRAALAYCRACEVKAACLEAAMANEEAFGVWGGTTERERRRIFRVQRRNRSTAA